MLKYYLTGFTILPSPPSLHSSSHSLISVHKPCSSVPIKVKFSSKQVSSTSCKARRRVRYDEEEYEEYGHNAEIAMLELYSQSNRDEILIVRALVDDQEVQVVTYKGFSSCLSYETSPDPSRSVLPARAIIKSIDRVKGPFDPSNIYYLEKGLTWDTFKGRLQPR